MEYRYLGTSGLQVSALALGSWVTFGPQTNEDTAQEMVEVAYNGGVNFFDTAEVYAAGEAETILGHIVKRARWKRSDLVISTKIFWGGQGPNDRGLSRKHLVEGLNASLARLQLEYIDLLFAHRPDIHTPIEETVRAMTYLIDQGKAFYWGTSEWSAQQIMEAYAVARREHLIPPTMEQPQYNMFHRERFEVEYARLYKEIGLGTTIWSPLAGGLLTGKYNQGIPKGTRASLPGFEWLRERYTGPEAERRIAKVKQLLPLAAALDCSMAQLALAWTLKNEHVSSVITGASRPAQIEDNLGALAVAEKLDDNMMTQIEEILDNKPQAPIDFR